MNPGFAIRRKIWSRLPRPDTRFLFAALAILPLLFVLACYDEDAWVSLAVSPDGRWLAATTEHHELGILDLRAPETPFTIYSNYASDRFSWSPDSTRLAYVENYPNHPCMLWLLDPKSGRL